MPFDARHPVNGYARRSESVIGFVPEAKIGGLPAIGEVPASQIVVVDEPEGSRQGVACGFVLHLVNRGSGGLLQDTLQVWSEPLIDYPSADLRMVQCEFKDLTYRFGFSLSPHFLFLRKCQWVPQGPCLCTLNLIESDLI